MKYFVPALGVPCEVITWCYNSNLPRQSRLINFYNTKVDFNAVKQPYKNPNDKRIKARIAAGSKGTRSYDWFNDIQLVKNVSKEKNHPCPMPVELIKRIILMTTNEGDTVFDPFNGGGTTAIACLETGGEYLQNDFLERKDQSDNVVYKNIDKEYFVKKMSYYNMCETLYDEEMLSIKGRIAYEREQIKMLRNIIREKENKIKTLNFEVI